MKKTCIGLFFLICGALNGHDCFLEGKIGYFLPTNNRFQKIYPGGPIYGLEFDYQIWNPIYSWIEIDYFTKTGRTEESGDHTQIQLVQLSLGFQWIYNQHWIQPYIGAGPQATYLNSHVDSEFLIRKESKWGIGALFKTGFVAKISKAFLIDLFTNYSWQTMDMHRPHQKKLVTHKANVSGFSFGGGIRYRF